MQQVITHKNSSKNKYNIRQAAALAYFHAAAPSARPPPRGLPPSWARRPGHDLLAVHTSLYGEAGDLSQMKAWRRKLIAFKEFCDLEHVRPPYYGEGGGGVILKYADRFQTFI